MKKEFKFISRVFNQAFDEAVEELDSYSNKSYELSDKRKKLLREEFELNLSDYEKALNKSLELAKQSIEGNSFNENRISYNNKEMQGYKEKVLNYFPRAANAWVLDGLIFEKQSAGIKKLVGVNGEKWILDVLNSASSLSLGAQNPWLLMADRYEDYIGVRDNICAAYHVSLRQGFALEKLGELYPNRKIKDLNVHIESSGSNVDSIAIETVSAFVDSIKDEKDRKILAVDGTWAGSYGSSKEATGFGVSDQYRDKFGKSVWIDRCLPAPTVENGSKFLEIIENKIKNNEAGGLYIEPDVIGDLGMLKVDVNVLREALYKLSKEDLPIIFDCVQQLGRTGSYWGENVDRVCKSAKYLILTTAKSSANGQPFGFVIMPKEIADCAYPLSQISTNQMNGPLLRAIVISKVFSNTELQKWLMKKAKDVVETGLEYGFEEDSKGLRGKYLNRGIYVGDNDTVKLAQIALLIEDGVLVGAVPEAVRYQPMLLEFSETNKLIAEIIFNRINKVMIGEISNNVLEIYNKMNKVATGLAR